MDTNANTSTSTSTQANTSTQAQAEIWTVVQEANGEVWTWTAAFGSLDEAKTACDEACKIDDEDEWQQTGEWQQVDESRWVGENEEFVFHATRLG